MRILVTGATGWVGRALLERVFVREGWRVRGSHDLGTDEFGRVNRHARPDGLAVGGVLKDFGRQHLIKRRVRVQVQEQYVRLRIRGGSAPGDQREDTPGDE
jgi:hypothetical protein